MTRGISAPDWVDKQHKTMMRWVESKLDIELTDLATDLSDGLVLIALVNRIVLETTSAHTASSSSYSLAPLYKHPKFKLQKTENVNDFLDFIRLVLKINVLGINAESIVEGDLKSILGLLWTLFVFSSSTSISKLSEGTSIIQVKQILLNWLNSVSKLIKVCNFDRDWSIEVNDPGMIFELILNKYLPAATAQLDHNNKKLQNLCNILDFATALGIPKLADVDDFVQLVPDEKCILFYLIEWYKYFELDSTPRAAPQNPQDDKSLDAVIAAMEHTIRLKYEYETKALRHLNKINSTLLKLQDVQAHPIFPEVAQALRSIPGTIHGHKCSDDDGVVVEKLTEFINFLHLAKDLSSITKYLNTTDIPELTNIYQQLVSNLKIIDRSLGYEPSKSLHQDNLNVKMAKLIKAHNEHCEALRMETNKVLQSLLHLPANSVASNQQTQLNELANELRTIIKSDLQDIRKVVSTQQAHLPGERVNTLKSQYSKLKQSLLAIEQPLSCGAPEIRKVFENLASPNFDYSEMKSLISFIPTKTVHITASDSDFSLVLDDEDDEDVDHSKLIFENNRKRVGSQLSGNNDRVYDLNELFIRFEDNLRV